MPNNKDVLNMGLEVTGTIVAKQGSELAARLDDALDNNRKLNNLFSEFGLPSAFCFLVTSRNTCAIQGELWTTYSLGMFNC